MSSPFKETGIDPSEKKNSSTVYRKLMLCAWTRIYGDDEQRLPTTYTVEEEEISLEPKSIVSKIQGTDQRSLVRNNGRYTTTKYILNGSVVSLC